MYAGFSLALLWGSLQAIYVVRFSESYFQLLSRIQKYISIRKLFPTRISGPTYEPNWFAEQLSFLLLPWLLSAVLTGYSAFKWRWRWITVEMILLFWTVLLVPLTFSRAGLIVLIAVAFVGLIVFRTNRNGNLLRVNAHSKRIIRRILEAVTAIIIVISLTYFLGRNNEFFSRIWLFWSERNNPTLGEYFDYLGFGARFIYNETALRIFNAYPIFGVGLGNYAFFFEEMLPDQPLAIMPEVLRLVTPGAGDTGLITSKNLYFRLLAETGLLGMATFLAFVVAILGCAIYLWLSKNKERNYFGVAGMLGLLAFGLSAFSYDSFALPNMWVLFGLITAAMWMKRTPKMPTGHVEETNNQCR
jgi:O-antigen ligase